MESLLIRCYFLCRKNQPPEERYASQLEQLAIMGFGDREANIRGKSQSAAFHVLALRCISRSVLHLKAVMSKVLSLNRKTLDPLALKV